MTSNYILITRKQGIRIEYMFPDITTLQDFARTVYPKFYRACQANPDWTVRVMREQDGKRFATSYIHRPKPS